MGFSKVNESRKKASWEPRLGITGLGLIFTKKIVYFDAFLKYSVTLHCTKASSALDW